MAKRNGFGVYPGARISAQQVTLIAVSVLALILMITTLVAFNKVSDANETQNAQYDKLITRFESEINAVQLMVDNQKNESGDARISTLNDIIKHVYAADALRVQSGGIWRRRADFDGHIFPAYRTDFPKHTPIAIRQPSRRSHIGIHRRTERIARRRRIAFNAIYADMILLTRNTIA